MNRFIIRKDKFKEFVQEFNKNVQPKEFWDECKKAKKLFRNNKSK